MTFQGYSSSTIVGPINFTIVNNTSVGHICTVPDGLYIAETYRLWADSISFILKLHVTALSGAPAATFDKLHCTQNKR